jgi:hypothetical protein
VKRDKYNIVPAQAGFYAGIIDAKTLKILWSPVIAWLIERRETANSSVWPKPITPIDGSGADTVFVKCPDGRIESELGIFDNEETALKSHLTKSAGLRFPWQLVG